MKFFNRSIVAVAVFVAVLGPALAVGAQSVEDPAYWETQFQHEARCHSSSEAGHGFVTDDGLSVVLFEFDLTWTYGDHWEGVVVFGGGSHIAYEHPDAGVPYPAPDGAAVTDWIVCKGVSPATTTSTTTTTTTTTSTSTTLAPEGTTTTTAAPDETTTTTAAPDETTTTTAAPETTTSTSVAPAGGVATGAGGTASSDQSVLPVLGGAAAIALAAIGAGYAVRRRFES